MSNQRLQNEAVSKIIEQFSKDYGCQCGSIYDFERGKMWYMVADPKTSTYIKFSLDDEKTHDIAYMIKTKETLYDTLVQRYNER